jgi:tRNA(Ile)-lysidine synthase
MYLNKQNFHREISTLLPKYEEVRFLLAASGGADSMVMANLLKSFGIDFQIAHINYKLRGEDSDLDEMVVRDFCKKNEIKFHVYRVSEQDKKPQNSIQLWARHLRYAFFNKIKSEENLDYIVTAHHLNDELETFIINLSRASALQGLSGIPKNKNQILRPLLKFCKTEIYKFAAENNIEFREDKSNQKSDYLRNFIRHEITPQLLKTNGNFLENFSKTLTYLDISQDFILKEIEQKQKNLSTEINGKIVFNKEKLRQETDFVKFELLKTYGFKKMNEIGKIFTAENGSRFFSKTHCLKITSRELVISFLDTFQIDWVPISINKTSEIHISDYVVNYQEQKKIWKVNAGKIHWPIILRSPLPTDIFHPFGMKGKKSVQKFIRELKRSETENLALVLADSLENVLGIVPFRQNEDFFNSENFEIFTIFL